MYNNAESVKKMREHRKKMNLCRQCGAKKNDNLSLCPRCRTSTYESIKKLNKRKFEENRCNIGTCKNKRLVNNRLCETHRLKELKKEKKRDLKLINNGLCTACGSEEYMNSYKDKSNIRSKFCQTCYLKIISVRHFGTVSKWKELFNILVEQNYICPFTGDQIILGINDSIDHIFPKGKYPEKSKDIANLRWIIRIANSMKYNLLDEEFMLLIEKIYKHKKEMGKGKKLTSPPPLQHPLTIYSAPSTLLGASTTRSPSSNSSSRSATSEQPSRLILTVKSSTCPSKLT